MTPRADIAGTAHPAPHRERASARALAYSLGGAPAAWFLRLLVNYGLARWACTSASSVSAWRAVVVVDVIAIAVAVGAGLVSYTLFHRSRMEKKGDSHELMEAGEGRTRFLAACGIFTSALFVIAIVADLAGPFMGLPCG